MVRANGRVWSSPDRLLKLGTTSELPCHREPGGGTVVATNQGVACQQIPPRFALRYDSERSSAPCRRTNPAGPERPRRSPTGDCTVSTGRSGSAIVVWAQPPAQPCTYTTCDGVVDTAEELRDRPHRRTTALIRQHELGDNRECRHDRAGREPRTKRMPEPPGKHEPKNCGGGDCDERPGA